MNGRLIGRQTCHLTEDLEESDYAIVIGANPWQSHGIPRARKVIQAFRRDPKRTLVVIDPRRTITAEYADIHLQVRDAGNWFEDYYPEEIDELVLEVEGEIKDLARLKRLFSIFARMMNDLCRLGSAYES